MSILFFQKACVGKRRKKVIIVERVIFLVELLLFHLFLDEEKTEYNYKQREKIKRI